MKIIALPPTSPSGTSPMLTGFVLRDPDAQGSKSAPANEEFALVPRTYCNHEDEATVFVSQGAGTYMLRVRIASSNEIDLLLLRPGVHDM